MAGIIADMKEYEQLKEFEVCSDEQIRECIRKRENFKTKITKSEKTMRDFLEYIIFERKVLKWVNEKEPLHGSKMTDLKSSIATRIIRLCRDGLRHFPQEKVFWEQYIQFSKKSAPHEVSGIYEKMLTFHGDKQAVWCNAALWAYEYSSNVAQVKEIFSRGLELHPDSISINRTFFDILLTEASKMSTERTPGENTSEQDIGLEDVAEIYRNSKKKITKVTYFLSLIERCEQDQCVTLSAPVQKIILDDLMQFYPRDEKLWDALAQRELRGFNMCDLVKLRKVEVEATAAAAPSVVENPTPTAEGAVDAASAEEPQGAEGNATTTSGSQVAGDDEPPNVKDASLKGVWQKRTLKRRIELCCSVYQTAVRTLKTPLMWNLYINAMLKLNQDKSTQELLKLESLAAAFKEGHESGLMSVDHYCTFLNMLLESPKSPNVGFEIAETVLSEAVKTHKARQLYEIWLSMYIVENDEPKIYEIFRKAVDVLKPGEAVPLWRLTLQFYKTRYDDCLLRLKRLYKEACQQQAPEFGVFRGEFLEFCHINMSMKKTRLEYDKMCKLPPPCLELHQKMAELESHLVVRSKTDWDRWRLCHENAVHYFGKTHSKVWIDYIEFERGLGKTKLMSAVYQRAKSTLESNLVDNFVSEYTLLSTKF